MVGKYNSDISRTVHRAMKDMYDIGVVDNLTMREMDRMCLTKTADLKPAQIRAIRVKAGVSQAVFAEHLDVTSGHVSKWECGEKHPSRMALKMLALVKAKGLDVIA